MGEEEEGSVVVRGVVGPAAGEVGFQVEEKPGIDSFVVVEGLEFQVVEAEEEGEDHRQ